MEQRIASLLSYELLMDVIRSLPYHVIQEMTPKGNMIRECTEIKRVVRDLDTPSKTLYYF